MAKKSQAELQREERGLRDSINATNNQISKEEAKLSNLKDKKQRLIQARNAISSAKSDARSARNKDKDCINDNYKWRGSKKDSFDSKGDNIISSNKSYISRVDDIHDALNDAISDVDIEISDKEGLLSSLGSRVRWLGRKLNNLWN